MRIRLRYPDVETFIERYSSNVSRGGMFIQSRAPQPVGTVLRFQMTLQNGTLLLKGEGYVIWVKEYDAAHPASVHGMGVRFTSLDDASEALLERILAFKSTGSPLSLRSSTTQEVRALARAALTEPEEPDASLAEAGSSPRHSVLDAIAPGPAPGATEHVPSAHDPAPVPGDTEPLPAPVHVSAVTPDQQLASPSLDGPDDEAQTLGSHSADWRVAEPDARGSHSTASLAAAERALAEILAESAISEERVEETLARVLASPVPDPAAVLEDLLRDIPAPVAPPPAPRGGSGAGRAAVKEGAPSTESFDPTLLEAAARTAQAASKATTEQVFDLTDGTPAPSADGIPVEAELPTVAAPPVLLPDPGWRGLRTATELLDHSSSRVLRDMAQYAGAREQQEDSTRVEAPPAFASLVAEAQLTGASAAEAEEAVTDPLVPTEGESIEDLSSNVWREVVAEAVQDLAAELKAETPHPAGTPEDVAETTAFDAVPAAGDGSSSGPGIDRTLTSETPALAAADESTAVMEDSPFDEGSDLVLEALRPDLPGDDLGLESDALPADPDLDSDIFDALAQGRHPAPDPARSRSDHEGIPSRGGASPDQLGSSTGEPSETADSETTEVAPVEESDLEGDQEATSPRRSGILRRFFRKKEET
jgi:uncharacterized protein (TIGR02266 family)